MSAPAAGNRHGGHHAHPLPPDSRAGRNPRHHLACHQRSSDHLRGQRRKCSPTLEGSIEEGDAARFDKLVDSVPAKKAIVFLTGPGGRLTEGLMIGETIRAHGYATSVIDHCASVCGLIWLAGTNRYTNESSGVGFHAAYTKDGSDVRESGRANAMVGAYLTRLGLSYAVVDFVTTAPPDKITWMKTDDTERLGIKVTFVPTKPVAACRAVARAA